MPEVAPQHAPESGQGEGITPEGGSPSGGNWLETTFPEDFTIEVEDEGGEARQVRAHEHPKLSEFKTPGDLAKAFLEQQKVIGKQSGGLLPLAEDATDEDRAKWQEKYRKIKGVPDTAEGYPELQMAEGVEVNKDLLGFLDTMSLAVGLSPQERQAVGEEYSKFQSAYWAEQIKQAEAEKLKAAENIKAHFEGRGMNPEEGSELAMRGYEAMAQRAGLDPEKVKEWADFNGDDDVFVPLFAEIGKAMQEDETPDGGRSPGSGEAEETSEQYYARKFPNSTA